MEREINQDVGNRLATIEGHIRAVRKMLTEDKGCVDIITQLMAVEKAVKKTSVIVLKNHLNTCIKDAVEKGDTETVAQFNKILEMYL